MSLAGLVRSVVSRNAAVSLGSYRSLSELVFALLRTIHHSHRRFAGPPPPALALAVFAVLLPSPPRTLLPRTRISVV